MVIDKVGSDAGESEAGNSVDGKAQLHSESVDPCVSKRRLNLPIVRLVRDMRLPVKSIGYQMARVDRYESSRWLYRL